MLVIWFVDKVHNAVVCAHVPALSHPLGLLSCNLQMVALHKDRYVFPVSVYVSRFSGNGADSVFMGIIKVRCSPWLHAGSCAHLNASKPWPILYHLPSHRIPQLINSQGILTKQLLALGLMLLPDQGVYVQIHTAKKP